jgi:RNA polymerase sigma-70 factor (ECF subfamily)
MRDMTTRFDEVSRAFPAIRLGRAEFESYLSTHEPIDEDRAQDAFLAAAIEARDAGALAWLVAEVQTSTRALGSRLDSARHDDVASTVLEVVAVRSGDGSPLIRRYAPTGSLRAWLRVVVARTAFDVGATVTVELDALTELQAPDSSPEVVVLRHRLAGALKDAASAAVATLSDRERTLVRLHWLNGVGLEELARMYQVHRATISRWLQSARERFLDAYRAEVARRGAVLPGEVDSLVRLLASQLDVSLTRLLAADVAGPTLKRQA